MSTDQAIPIRESASPHAYADYQLLSVQEVATLLAVDVRTVWRTLSKHAMPEPVRFGGNTRWKYCQIRDWIDRGCPAHN